MKFSSEKYLGHSAGGRVIFLSFIVTLWSTKNIKIICLKQGKKLELIIHQFRLLKSERTYFLRKIVVNSGRFFPKLKKWDEKQIKETFDQKIVKNLLHFILVKIQQHDNIQSIHFRRKRNTNILQRMVAKEAYFHGQRRSKIPNLTIIKNLKPLLFCRKENCCMECCFPSSHSSVNSPQQTWKMASPVIRRPSTGWTFMKRPLSTNLC